MRNLGKIESPQEDVHSFHASTMLFYIKDLAIKDLGALEPIFHLYQDHCLPGDIIFHYHK